MIHKYLFFVCILVVSSTAIAVEQRISDKELAARDSMWFSCFPYLPIWETLPEKEARLTQPSASALFSRAVPPAPVRNVAEFEPMEGVLLSYPSSFGIPVTSIKEMAQDVTVYCITQSTSSAQSAMQSGGVDMNNVKMISGAVNSIYTRDFGPWWIVNGEGKFGIVDFTYNRNRPDDDLANGIVGTFLTVPVYFMDLKHCGGNYMTDGWNSSTSSKLVIQENGNNESNVKNLHKQYLGIETYNLLDDPNNTYIDHVDCWGKYLTPDKILIRSVPQSNADYASLEKVVDYYKSIKTPFGTSYKIFRVTSTASNEAYTNSLILNKKVFVPIANTSNDAPALAEYKKALPGHSIIGVNFSSFQNTDAFHCRTKGIADRGMLFVRHLPLHDTVTSANGSGYQIEASIIAYSGKKLFDDSLRVFYRKASDAVSAYSSVRLQKSAGNTYKAVIPPPKESYDIAYYVHAADESGRSESQPYTGDIDPFIFYAKTDGITQIISQTAQHGHKMVTIRKYHGGVIISFTHDKQYPGAESRIYIIGSDGSLIRRWSVNPGTASVVWDGTTESKQHVAAGVYFCVVKKQTETVIEKISIAK